VVDGLDGCGKDTHAQNISRFLEARGEKVMVVSHPSGRRFGRISKRSLEGSGPLSRLSATLFFTADVLVSVRLLKKQRDGTAVFVRYTLGTAYLPRSLASTGYRFFHNLLPRADLAFYIDTDPTVARRRIVARGGHQEMFESIEKLRQVREVVRSLTSKDWITIDNSVDGEGPFRAVEKVLDENWSSRR
jgi:dTMP kinase